MTMTERKADILSALQAAECDDWTVRTVLERLDRFGWEEFERGRLYGVVQAIDVARNTRLQGGNRMTIQAGGR